MQSLKTASIFRPISRPSSPSPAPSRPDSGVGLERTSRPLTKLSLSNFRRPSPAPTPSTPPPHTLVQDGSYLEMLSLKLSEAISKALSQPTGVTPAIEVVAGRRAIPAGRGRALGALIASELTAAKENPHLHRAIIRSLHRPLSVLLSNLSSYLLPLISSPAFIQPSALSVQSPNPNPTQAHALAISAFAEELLSTFDDLGLGFDADVRGDGLKIIREGLTSIVKRVTDPLISNLKSEILPLLDALETPSPGKKVTVGGKTVVVHPSIVALQSIVPVYAKVLGPYATSPTSHTALASFLISIVWRALVALAHRRILNTPPPSPGPAKRRGSPTTTPPLTPPPSKFIMKLPSPASRPPSPTRSPGMSLLATDAHALYEVLSLFTKPGAGKGSIGLAGEAVDEAFSALKAIPLLADTVSSLSSKLKAGQSVGDMVATLEDMTVDVPTLIALSVVLQGYGSGNLSVPQMLGLSEAEYRSTCLTGFGRADECAAVVGQRVLDNLSEALEGGPVIMRWLDGEIEEAEEVLRR